MKENLIAQKTLDFAIKIVKLNDFLLNEKKEFILAKQILRSGTSIGANCAESAYAISKKDFINKFFIALKEASETRYWLILLNATKKIEVGVYEELLSDCEEIIKIITRIVKTAQENQ